MHEAAPSPAIASPGWLEPNSRATASMSAAEAPVFFPAASGVKSFNPAFQSPAAAAAAAVSFSRTITWAIPSAATPSVPGAMGRKASALAAVIERRGPKWTNFPRTVGRAARILP